MAISRIQNDNAVLLALPPVVGRRLNLESYEGITVGLRHERSCFFNCLETLNTSLPIKHNLAIIDHLYAYIENEIKKNLSSMTEDCVTKIIFEDAVNHFQSVLGLSLEEAYDDFENAVKKTSEKIFNTVIKKHMYGDQREFYKKVILSAAFQRKVAQSLGYQLQLATNDSIDAMIQLINDNGYMMVNGQFGEAFYTKQPTLKNILGMDVKVWPKNTFDSKASDLYHYVIIVGASKQGYCGSTQNLIYFIDPTNEKNPENPSIYCISYDSFQQRLATPYGFSLPDASANLHFISNPQFMRDELELTADLEKVSAVEEAEPMKLPAVTTLASSASSFWNCKKAALTVAAVGVGITAIATSIYSLTNRL
jgi:hypothetical protein